MDDLLGLKTVALTIGCLIVCQLNAQICSGSLGENIFLEGDFGSGASNFLQSDPQIAPGYVYTVTPPPQDGLYSISNNTGQWNNLFGTWLEIGDNSTDPNGYMMVVNASFEPGLFYEQTVDGLCENTLYVFSVDIINMIRVGVPDHIKPNVSFLIDNQVGFTSGEIPQDAAWHNYGFTFTTAPGQTTIQLSLQNNAPGGIGNDLALDNISFRPCGPEAFILPETIANICEDGDPINLEATVIGDQYATPVFQWQLSVDFGASWNDIDGATSDEFLHSNLNSGYYYYRFLLANDPLNLGNTRCRVISNEKIVFVQPKFYDVTDTICTGLAVNFGGETYDETGIYIDSLTSSIGCDSIVTLDLTVVDDPGITASYSLTDLTCHDQPTGSLMISEIINAVDPVIVWVDQLVQENLQTDGLDKGLHEISIVDRYGCNFQDTFSIMAPQPFEVDIGTDTSVLLGTVLQFTATGNFSIESFEWLAVEDPSCQDCMTVSILPFGNQSLILNAISESGCFASDTLYIEVSDERALYFPNAFTPNGDQQNDFFNLFAPSRLLQTFEKLSIYDRWGGLLWSQSNIQPNSLTDGWPGTAHNGEILNPGVYLFMAEVRLIDGQVSLISGDVTLIR